MANSIRAIESVAQLAPRRIEPVPNPITTSSVNAASLPSAIGGASGQGKGFMDVLTDAMGEARRLERTSEDMSERFGAGDPSIGIHEVVIASEKASIALRFAVTLKNRALEAYRELMSTQI